MGLHINNPGNSGDGTVRLAPWFYDSVEQGTWAFAINATYFYNGDFTNSTAASGDGLNFKAYLARGTYKWILLAHKANNAGIIKLNVDGTTEDSNDTYAAVASLNQRITSGSTFTVGKSGVKDIQILSNTKNAGSSAYQMYLIDMVLVKTA